MPRERWVDVTLPFIKNENVFRCVDPEASNPEVYGFAFNGLLSRKLLKHVPNPESTPCVYDSDNYFKNAFDHVSSLPRPGRHLYGNNIGFVDGHVKRVRNSEQVDAFPRQVTLPAGDE